MLSLLLASAVTVILAGQSNMVGFAVMRAEDRLPTGAAVGVVNAAGLMRDDRAPWTRTATAGIGPGRSFAQGLLALRPEITTIYAVQCAQGGTAVTSWLPGAKAGLMKRCLDLAAGMPAAFRAPVVAVIWAQGETEAKGGLAATAHAGHLRSVIAGFRAAFGPVPFVAADLPEGLYLRDRDVVSAGIREVIGTTENAAIVETYGLTMRTDRIHYDRDGAIALGNRFAEAIAPMLEVIQ